MVTMYTNIRIPMKIAITAPRKYSKGDPRLRPGLTAALMALMC